MRDSLIEFYHCMQLIGSIVKELGIKVILSSVLILLVLALGMTIRYFLGAVL